MTDWYSDQYQHDDAAENPFGLSSLSQTPSRALLTRHIRAGGLVTDFFRAKIAERAAKEGQAQAEAPVEDQADVR